MLKKSKSNIIAELTADSVVIVRLIGLISLIKPRKRTIGDPIVNRARKSDNFMNSLPMN